MCEPMTIAAGAMLAGSAMSAVGTYQQGEAANAAAQFNVAQGEVAAADAYERAEIDKQMLAQQFLKDKASGRTQFAASGMRLGTGSTLDWENDLSEVYVADKAQIDENTSKVVSGIRGQQTLDYYSGRSAKVGAAIGATGSLLSGAAKAGSMAYTPGG